jgi:hypothetical protein
MNHTFNLQAFHQSQPSGTLKWNSETGELGGPLAAAVEPLVKAAVKSGTITSQPYPTQYKISQPLTNQQQLAAVIATRWQLPEELANELATTEEPETEVPVLH